MGAVAALQARSQLGRREVLASPLRLKTCRKAAREKDDACTLGPTSQGYQDECPPGSPLAYPPPAAAAPFSGEEQELHYASLSFLKLRPWEPRDQAATSTTEYAEIKILK